MKKFRTIFNTDKIFEIITENNLSADKVFNLFVNWFGCSICTDDFLDYVKYETFNGEIDKDEKDKKDVENDENEH